MSQIYVNIVLF